MKDKRILEIKESIQNTMSVLGCTMFEAAEREGQYIESFVGELTEEHISQIEQAKQMILNSLKHIEILQTHSILTPHTSWYTGPNEGSRHWLALRDYLAITKGWGDATVDKINESSNEVVSLLADPQKKEFQYRGLVVGYVQSGKTANMTAVISKAVDAGYNMIIVLAGLTNKLRQQTQQRLEEDLIDRTRWFQDVEWFLWTNSEDDGDFRKPKGGKFAPPNDGLIQFGVLKKNVSPLRQFRRTLIQTPRHVLRSLRILLIDDECDSASVNASSNEMNMTAINKQIRSILHQLPAVTYVGYTATPFANVLINPYQKNDDLDDLYPRNFITALSRPDGYFGTELLFGKEPEDPGNLSSEEEGLDMIRTIPDEDIDSLQPKSRKDKDTFNPSLPESLQDALLYFIMACAARLTRKQHDSHMTMLVHTSVFTILHERVSELIEAWLDNFRRLWANSDGYQLARIKNLWQKEQNRLPDELTDEDPIDFEQLVSHIKIVLDRIETPIENGFSDNRIDYKGSAKIYIVVGGTVLARGLTLEGLMVSYFLRTTTQYDTLLQMGRWFGFRRGYEDLPRIWMTNELQSSFRMLATVEAEIREDIREYTRRRVNPMEFAVRVRSIPGMAITSANKMRHAVSCDISYSGKHRQTIRFEHRNPHTINKCWDAASELLQSADKHGQRIQNDERILYTNVPHDSVQRFFHFYKVHEDHRELSAELLNNYIQETSDLYLGWNVGLYQPHNGRISERTIGNGIRPRLSGRAKLKGGQSDTADIKALMSKKDVVFDCEEVPPPEEDSWDKLKNWRQNKLGRVPLLLLYVIDKDSCPKSGSKNRESLEAIDDIIGFGVVFPTIPGNQKDYVSVNLSPTSADEIESLDEEVTERIEAGDAI